MLIMRTSKVINSCNIYTALWCLIHLKGILYNADIISVFFYGIVMVMSIYYFLKVILQNSRHPLLKSLNALTIWLALYGVINVLFGGDVRTSWNIIPSDFYLKNILNSLLPIYAYYFFAQKGLITKEWLIRLCIILLFVGIGRYYLGIQKAMEIRMVDSEEVTNNAGYIMLALMPLACFLNRRPILQYSYLVICFLFVVSAMKRGAILIGILCIILFLASILSSVSRKQKLTYLLLSAGIICVAYFFFVYMMDTNEYFVRRLDDTISGNSSQRDSLYAFFFNMMFNRNLFYILLGQGADTTIRLGPNYAHNDWLEIGVNQGLIGIAIYAIFFYQLYKHWRTMPKKSIISTAIGMCFLILFGRSLVSMSVNSIEIYISIVIGYSIACARNKQLLNDCTA